MRHDGAKPLLHVAQVLALAGLYIGTARLGLALGAVHTFATPIWPPTGIALAALLLGGSRLWPGVALGAFIANRWMGASVLVALGISAGNTLEALAGAYLVRRVGRFQGSLDELRAVLALIGLGAITSTAISASVGVSSLLLSGRITRGDFAEIWRVWWLGDAAGDLLIAPLILTWRQPRRFAFGSRQAREAIALGAAVIAASAFIFAQPYASEANRFIQACVLVPVLMWGALRFGTRGATATVFLASLSAVWGTAVGRGPFTEATVSSSLMNLQSFAAITATAMLIVGAVTEERADAFRREEGARRRSETLASLGRTFSAAGLDLQEAMERSMSQVLDQLRADDCALFLAEDGGHLLRGAWELQPERRIGMRLDLDELHHTRMAAEQRESVYFTRAEAAGAEPDWLRALGAEAALAAPLLGEGGRFIGALYLSFWEDHFSSSSEDLEFVNAVAGLCALAVARAQVYEQEQNARIEAKLAADRLALAQSITSDLAAARTQVEVASVLLERGLKAFGAKAISVSVPISDEELEVIQEVGEQPSMISPQRRVRIDSRALRAEAFRTGQGVWVESSEETVRRYPQLESRIRELGDRAWAAIPMIGDTRSLGVFTLAFPGPRTFGEEERRFISFLASKYGQALDRARLYEAERVARAGAEGASVRAGLLASLGAKLNAGYALPEVLSAAASGAKAVLAGDDAALWLAETDSHRLRGAFEIGSAGRVEAVLDLEELPHSREAVARRWPVYFTPAEASGAERAWLRDMGIEGALAAPLLDQERFIGLLFVVYMEDRFTRTQEDLQFVNAVAGLCTLALARAQTYEAEKDARLRAEVAEREARRIGLLQERLVAMASHDLQNPLGALTIAIERLTKRRASVEPWQHSTVSLMARSAERMRRIIADMLDVATARHGGRIAVSPEAMSLADVCRDVIAEFEETRPGRGVLLSVEGDDRGQWDPGRLAQVVSNLVANALQHSPEGATVEVRIRGSRRNLVLEVYNSGPPIPPDVVPLIFEPFARGPGGRGAVGLGLFIVREIARAHGGTVDVCSREDKGTSFAVKLPRSAPVRGDGARTLRH